MEWGEGGYRDDISINQEVNEFFYFSPFSLLATEIH